MSSFEQPSIPPPTIPPQTIPPQTIPPQNTNKHRQRHMGYFFQFLLCCLLLWPSGTALAKVYQAPTQQDEGFVFPRGQSDFLTIEQNTSILIDVLANDFVDEDPPDNTPPDQSGIRLVTTNTRSNPRNGKSEIVGDKILYTPNFGFVGRERFTYKIALGDDPQNISFGFVFIDVEEAANAPTDITISTTTIREGVRGLVATFGVVDPRGSGPHVFSLTSRTVHPDNDFFVIVDSQLGLGPAADFETKPSYTIGVDVSNRTGKKFAKEFTLNVIDVNNAPTAINLSNNRIDEIQEGQLVGELSTVDSDSDDHTYELIDDFSGGADSHLFAIVRNQLFNEASLDFEEKASYRIRVRSTDDKGASFDELLVITLNDVPAPPDKINNGLSFCSGDPITLIERASSRKFNRVLIKIDDVDISEATRSGCTVNGDLSITTNGVTISSLAFRGEVNARNQFGDTSMPAFKLGIAGITLEADDVEVQYENEQPSLHIGRPRLRMPKEFGGLSASLPVPSVIDAGGVRFGTGELNLPTISTKSGFELDLSGSLERVSGGFEISADGSITIPNIGKKKKSGSKGQTCTISAGVTIFANARGQTVMAIAAGDALEQPRTAPFLENVAYAQADDRADPTALDDFRLDAVRAGASCDPGLAIGSTGLFLTSISGEITVVPGEEQLDVEVTIEAGKSVPGLGPIVSLDGNMSLRPSPFKLSVGAALNVLSFEIAQASASLKRSRFKTSIRVSGFFYTASASIKIRSRSGRILFTGSGRAAIEVVKGAFGEKCFIACVDVPPFGVGPLASVRVDVGEFTTGDFGFKGVVRVIGISTGFFVDERGRLAFGSVSRFRLVRGQQVAAARAAQLDAQKEGINMTVDAAALQEFIFLENERGESEGVIISAPLNKSFSNPGEVRASDAITEVNLIQTGDVVFDLTATGPISLTLISPEGKEITPANYWDSAEVGHTVWYTQVVGFEKVEKLPPVDSSDPDVGIPSRERVTFDDEGLARLRFTALATNPALNGLDLRIGGDIYDYNIGWQDPTPSEPVLLEPGEHKIELLKHNTEDVVASATLNLSAGKAYSLISIGGAAPSLGLAEDGNQAPTTLGKAKVRFFNGSSQNMKVELDGSPLYPWSPPKDLSDYTEVDAGARTIEFRRQSDGALASAPLMVDLANGGVYTFMSTDYTTVDYNIAIVQRQDILYTPFYQTFYSIDQAAMGKEWKMKLVGDTDNTPYQVAVWGPDSPPILGSVTYDASNPAQTQVSWQLTSDVRPTKVSVFATSEEIVASFPVTDTDGTTTIEETPLFEGIPVGEFEITDLTELGGQMVTKVVDLSDLASGTWHLWVRAEDGVTPPVSTYASQVGVTAAGVQSIYGVNAAWLAKDDFDAMAQLAKATPLVIDRTGDFPVDWTATISQTFDADTNSLYIEWRTSKHPDADNYRLLWGSTPLSPTQVITTGGSIAEFDENGVSTGAEVGFVTLHDINPDVPYFISVEAVDTETGNSVRSQEVEFMVAAAAFALTTQVPNVSVKAGEAVRVPVTLSAEEALFFNNVWLSTDLGGTPPGVTAQYVDDGDGFNKLNATEPTKQLEISVDASVPSGAYPISITGYNGDKQEEMTFTLVVDGATVEPATKNIFLPLISK